MIFAEFKENLGVEWVLASNIQELFGWWVERNLQALPLLSMLALFSSLTDPFF